MNTQVVNREQLVLEMDGTVATRRYPFTQITLDQIKGLREAREDELYKETGKDIVVPAPIILADAVDLLHKQEFPETNKE